MCCTWSNVQCTWLIVLHNWQGGIIASVANSDPPPDVPPEHEAKLKMNRFSRDLQQDFFTESIINI